MERAKIVKGEMTEQNARFLVVYIETKNACLVLLSQNEDKLGTLAIAVPRLGELVVPPSSSILLGDKNVITARMFAEYVASAKTKIALVSIYTETIEEMRAQSILKKLVDKIVHGEAEKEGTPA